MFGLSVYWIIFLNNSYKEMFLFLNLYNSITKIYFFLNSNQFSGINKITYLLQSYSKKFYDKFDKMIFSIVVHKI